jgi:hypothetical protein
MFISYEERMGFKTDDTEKNGRLTKKITLKT